MPETAMNIRTRIVQNLCLRKQNSEDENAELSYSMYVLLRQMDGCAIAIDGWKYFSVQHESETNIEIIGLAYVLPTGSLPIEIGAKLKHQEIHFHVRLGDLDATWQELPSEKQWNRVYLYANGDHESPEWTWEPTQVVTLEVGI